MFLGWLTLRCVCLCVGGQPDGNGDFLVEVVSCESTLVGTIEGTGHVTVDSNSMLQELLTVDIDFFDSIYS